MKKTIRSIGALVMALIMMISIGTTASAEPQNTDTASISVINVEKGATVTAYLIAGAEYGEDGKNLKGYKTIEGVAIDDLTSPTEDEITTIAKAIRNGGITPTSVSLTGTGTTYKADGVEAGMYLVVISGTGETVYNPMIVSAGYDANSELQDGKVDSTSKFFDTGYAKSSKVTLDKTIENSGSGKDKGDDLAVGDTANFKIKTLIPSYSADYTSLQYIISDELSVGLTLDMGSIKVSVDGADVVAGDETYAVTSANDNGFTLTFAESYIRANGLKEVEVTYTATLNDQAEVNFDPNTNTAKLTFTNNPADGADAKEIKDKTYHYTFGIDANLGGTTQGKQTKTHEIIKVNEDGSVTPLPSTTEIIDGVEVEGPLANAKFKLTNTATNKEYEATTDNTGYLTFTGLDAGTYTLVETEAPTGYTLDTTEHSVVISATYNEDGTLQSYTITIDGEATSTYTATYNTDGEITDIGGTVETTTIKNTKISELPSTGGIGTYIFTALGIVIMVLAAAGYARSKKRPQRRNQ